MHSPGIASAVAWLVVVLLANTSPCLASDPIRVLLDDPDSALAFDYCRWRFADRGTGDGLPDLEPVLANEDGSATESELRAGALVDAGTKIALAASDERACRKAFASGTKLHEKARNKMLGRMKSKPRVSAEFEVASVQTEIHDLWMRDQAARNVYIASRTDDETGGGFWAYRLAYAWATEVDALATEYMRDAVETHEWIDAHRFGKKTANQAWLLVQHADDHPDFQLLVLERMEKHLADGGVDKRDYAYLWDRVAVNHGRKQRYGTQPDWQCRDGKLDLMPLEDPDRVDALRAEMGLGPVQEDLRQMSRSVCGGP